SAPALRAMQSDSDLTQRTASAAPGLRFFLLVLALALIRGIVIDWPLVISRDMHIRHHAAQAGIASVLIVIHEVSAQLILQFRRLHTRKIHLLRSEQRHAARS